MLHWKMLQWCDTKTLQDVKYSEIPNSQGFNHSKAHIWQGKFLVEHQLPVSNLPIAQATLKKGENHAS
jgi:hypothetical protein